MTIPEITTVCFVGAGTMGCYNAMVAAISGYKVSLYDVDSNCLAGVSQRQMEMATMLVGGGYCSRADLPAAFERILVTADLPLAIADADLVSESVFERLDIKRKVHKQLDQVCRPETILTTNSSVLQISQIEDAVKRGDRIAALHSHLGAPLVDIVPGPRTDPAVIEVLERYVESTGGVPLILKKENPGYVLNALLGPLLGTALGLVLNTDASREAVDASWISGQQAPMGPFGMMDMFGLNLILDTWRHRDRKDALQSLRPQILSLLEPRVERGELGMKSGKGFYHYPEPAYEAFDFVSAAGGIKEIHNCLQTVLIGNALLLAANEIASIADIDKAWQAGTHLSIGPFQQLSMLATGSILKRLKEAVAEGYFDAANLDHVTAYLSQGEAALIGNRLADNKPVGNELVASNV
ncbi:MAG: 3-hydroxyacyl-CoA dehydrogenase [Halioglobus sp.]|jgi:3-hydroxyacyl-CoA dehydrogenase